MLVGSTRGLTRFTSRAPLVTARMFGIPGAKLVLDDKVTVALVETVPRVAVAAAPSTVDPAVRRS